MVLGGAQQLTDPLALTDRRFFRLTISLFRERTEGGYRLKVRKSAFQYQENRGEKTSWIFRYDYLRQPPEREPGAHLSTADLSGRCYRTASRSGRFASPPCAFRSRRSFGCSSEEFGVPCNESDEVWRPALESTERAFFDVQHLPLSFAEPPHPRHPERNKARRKKCGGTP